jgi:23S rRNA (guanine745-N1)-methyltransferase
MPASHPVPAPWRCPVCRDRLQLVDGDRWACPKRHSFDVAKEGYVNLLRSGRKVTRSPGDSPEMVAARRRFLGLGAYDPMTEAVAGAVAAEGRGLVLDVGCGEGRHTRALPGTVLGVDVAKPAVAAAAKAHPDGAYAVASAADLPLADGAVDAAVNVFGPVMPEELGRVVKIGGVVVTASPGPRHLEELRRLVYDDAHPHEVKPPLRNAPDLFALEEVATVAFSLRPLDAGQLHDLFAMTPYRWHAPPDIEEMLEHVAAGGFSTRADIRVARYRRLDQEADRPDPSLPSEA